MKTNVKEYLKNNTKIILVICLALTGFILIALSYTNTNAGKENNDGDTELLKYGEYLENKLTQTLERITGENTVDIVITFDGSFEKVYLENHGQATNQTALYFDKEISTPITVKTKNPKIKGVMIVCTSISEKSEFKILKEAAATVLDISENKIYIIGGETDHEKLS